jgi:hypothetical protein
LEVDEQGKQSANVFFEAKYVVEGRSPEEARLDPRTVFQPNDLQYIQNANGNGYALVRRRGLALSQAPLKINLDTLKVTVLKKWFGVEGTSTRTTLGFSGRCLLRNGRSVWVNSGVASSSNSKRILFHDGWLYRPGYIWVRENADSGKRERLQDKTLPHAYWHLRVGSSAHYGLVTYDPYNRMRPLSQVEIAEKEVANGSRTVKKEARQ